MSIFTKSVVCSVVFMQAAQISCGDDSKEKATVLGERTKTALLLSAPYVAAWNTTRIRESVQYEPMIFDKYRYGAGLKYVTPSKWDIKPQERDYYYSNEFKNRQNCFIFKHELNKSIKNWYLIAVGTYIAKSLYDSFREYRNGSVMKGKK